MTDLGHLSVSSSWYAFHLVLSMFVQVFVIVFCYHADSHWLGPRVTEQGYVPTQTFTNFSPKEG